MLEFTTNLNGSEVIKLKTHVEVFLDLKNYLNLHNT